ncbi:hypothetical protein SLEP1_g36882 [Rubroshorea leprosula]|uniref:ER membrane protein complex subunit 10 n=1 Tax=Rubroshorea leprosula TaxID=152421 RepID=A0AAV5KSV3_9ROSI|nr:hypothetical protein SLEP1_g36882 [Rubroshorea leprosula]
MISQACVKLIVDTCYEGFGYVSPMKGVRDRQQLLVMVTQALTDPKLDLAPIFTEEVLSGENGEGEVVQPPERSFGAKHWMYFIPLGLIVMNTITQAMNMPEEQATGQSASLAHPTAAMQRASNAAVLFGLEETKLKPKVAISCLAVSIWHCLYG